MGRNQNEDDFLKTAERMYNDSQLLFEGRRWFNSCYLSGYVGECYAKIILSKELGESIRTHSLDELNSQLQRIMQYENVPSRYKILLEDRCPTRFFDILTTITVGMNQLQPNIKKKLII